MSKVKPTRLKLAEIRIDGGTQSREGIDQGTVDEYADAMQLGEQFPALDVYYDGSNYWLGDGFHRWHAAKQIGFRTFLCVIHQGTQEDAVLHSCGANAKHGLKRTNADKRRAVSTLLRHEVWSKWSDNKIASHCGVSQPFVGKLREEMTYNGYKSTERQGADGRVIDTGNIGKGKAPEEQNWPFTGLQPDKWYSVKAAQHELIGHPFDSHEEAMKGFVGNVAVKGSNVVSRGKIYQKYKLVKPSKEVLARLEYQAGLRASDPLHDAIQAQIDQQKSIIENTTALASDDESEVSMSPDEQYANVERWWEYLIPEKWYPWRHAERHFIDAAFDSPNEVKAAYPDWYAIQAKNILGWGERDLGKYTLLPAEALTPSPSPTNSAVEGNEEAGRHYYNVTAIIPTNKFPVIYIDPPWSYTVYSEDTGQGRSAEAHYPTMDAADMAGLPVGDLAADDCTLFMWATWPCLQQAFAVGTAWGFDYKTCAFTWAKLTKGKMAAYLNVGDDSNWHMGMGFYTRANTEVCLLFTKGKPKRVHADVRQLIVAPVRKHSQKPDEIYERIERLVGGPYVEVFSRQARPGWTAIGNEIDGLDVRDAIRAIVQERAGQR